MNRVIADIDKKLRCAQRRLQTIEKANAARRGDYAHAGNGRRAGLRREIAAYVLAIAVLRGSEGRAMEAAE